MIQTSLFNYFNCNNKNDPIKQSKYKLHSFKQTNLTDYFKVKPKKKNLILDYFIPKGVEKKKIFEVVLLDIKSTFETHNIICVKKDMYDEKEDLKYIAISYRWGELSEQLVKTPDYTAYITSFDLKDLLQLCRYIRIELDLKKIQYLWIDAISVDQQHHSRKKETILKMNEIYKRATYILAVPDLHLNYLIKNTANKEILDELIFKHRFIIYENILNLCNDQQSTTAATATATTTIINRDDDDEDNKEINKTKATLGLLNYFRKSDDQLLINETKEKEELKKVYKYLAYLVEDWANRAWVISEYHIAKEQYKQHGTPLKYIFVSLLNFSDPYNYPFFSYYFDDNDDDETIDSNNNNNKIAYGNVDNHNKFNQFLKSRFTERSHLDMMLNSNASRNEDRFNAILPSWSKYNHLIKNKYTISNWKITDMISLRLKLYEIMNDDDDFWDKATLLYACSRYSLTPILPSFASHYLGDYLALMEKDDMEIAYKIYESLLLKDIHNENERIQIQHYINNYNTEFGSSIYTENLTYIQLNQYHHYLSVKSNIYFISKLSNIEERLFNEKNILTYWPSDDKEKEKDDDDIYYVFIPFFTFTAPDYIQVPPVDAGTGIYLFGHLNKNRWIIFYDYLLKVSSNHFCSDDYTFNIY